MNVELSQSDADQFRINFALDDVKKRLNITLEGRIISRRYFDQCVAYYSQLHDPSRYDRLVDCTASEGYVTFDDLNALAGLWRTWLSGAPRVVNVAVISGDPLTHARMGIVDQLSDKQRHRAFYTIAEAEAWLEARRDG